jgi:hypothetical protein
VVFQAPRPLSWEGELGEWKKYQVSSRTEAPAFYLHATKTIVADEASKPTIRWEIILKRARLVEVTGRVLDAKGMPAAGAKVNLMSGELTESNWRNEVATNMRFGAIGSGSVSTGPGKAVHHKWVTTGPDGTFTLWYVQEDTATEEARRWAGRLSLGALLDGKHSPLRSLINEETARERCEVQLQIRGE